jgi:hypothetical protein
MRNVLKCKPCGELDVAPRQMPARRALPSQVLDALTRIAHSALLHNERFGDSSVRKFDADYELLARFVKLALEANYNVPLDISKHTREFLSDLIDLEAV